MRKLYFVLPIFLLFLAPVVVHADTYSNLVSVTDCNYAPASDTLFVLQNDIDCTANGISFDDGGTVTHYALDLNGYTIDATGYGFKSNGGDVQDADIYGGTVIGGIAWSSNSESGGLYFHDMTFNGTVSLGGGYSPLVIVVLKNVTINLAGQPALILSIGTFTFEDVTANCISGTCYDFGISNAYGLYFSTLYATNYRTNGMTSDLSTVGRVYFSEIILTNSTFIAPDNYTTPSYPTRWVFKEEAKFTAEDQNSAPINAMAHLVTLNQTGTNTLKDLNPDAVANLGLNNGTGTGFVTTKLYWYGTNNIMNTYDTYNVSVKARTQVSSKLVTFHSPADENFTLDFTSEDTGSDVVIDNRTVTEKGGNAITGIIAFLSPLALFLVPFLAVL